MASFSESKAVMLEFLREVHSKLVENGSDKETYAAFMSVLKQFREKTINTSTAIATVEKLFQQHSDLLIAFKSFMPTNYSSVSSAPNTFKTSDVEASMDFLNRVEARFDDNGVSYNKFLGYMGSYSKGEYTISQVSENILKLFGEKHLDLAMEFVSFLPESCSGEEKSVTKGRVNSPINPNDDQENRVSRMRIKFKFPTNPNGDDHVNRVSGTKRIRVPTNPNEDYQEDNMVSRTKRITFPSNPNEDDQEKNRVSKTKRPIKFPINPNEDDQEENRVSKMRIKFPTNPNEDDQEENRVSKTKRIKFPTNPNEYDQEENRVSKTKGIRSPTNPNEDDIQEEHRVSKMKMIRSPINPNEDDQEEHRVSNRRRKFDILNYPINDDNIQKRASLCTINDPKKKNDEMEDLSIEVEVQLNNMIFTERKAKTLLSRLQDGCLSSPIDLANHFNELNLGCIKNMYGIRRISKIKEVISEDPSSSLPILMSVLKKKMDELEKFRDKLREQLHIKPLL